MCWKRRSPRPRAEAAPHNAEARLANVMAGVRPEAAAKARAEWLHNRRDSRSLAIIISLPLVLLLHGCSIDFELRKLSFAIQA